MAAQSYFVRMRDGTITSVAGVQSETVVQEEVYDLDVHQFLFDAGSLGRAWAEEAAEGVGSPGPAVTGAIAENAVVWADQSVEGGTFLPPEALDDRVSKTPPAPTAKKRSRLKLWSGLAGAGDCLYAGWLDRIEAYSIGTFTRV